MPASTPSLLPPPPVRRHRTGAALGLAAAVLWLHAGLMVVLAPTPPPRSGAATEGSARATAVQVRTVAPGRTAGQVGLPAAAATPAAAAPSPAAPTPRTPRTPPTPPTAPTAPAAPAAPIAPNSPTAPVAPFAAVAAAAAAASAATATPAANVLPAVFARPASAPAEAFAAAFDGPVGSADLPAGGTEAPPIYATRIPPSVRLRYALRYNGRAGEATLRWQHDGERYQLALEGLGATEALVVQASQGGFDSAGLAPERFTDRRRGGRLQAANFRRDLGRIGFSGPAVDYPAWPGAQDRLSWLPQLVAIRSAAAAAAPAGEADRSPISLFVVDARGAAALWHFQPDGELGLTTPLGRLATQRWRREPPRPEGLRVEAWLDAARGHWPVQLRYTALRSGDVFELMLLDEPVTPP